MKAATTIKFLDQPCLEISDLANADIYKNMQGNILKGHGRDHATMIFIRFKSRNVRNIKKALFEFTEEYVTSFYKQLWERERYKRNNIPGDTFGALFISKKGYEYLGEKSLLADQGFKEGMKKRTTLNDPYPGENSGYDKDIDVMLLLADDDKTRMNAKACQVLSAMEKITITLRVEYGDAIRNANGDGLEHNGYVDGISQPLFLKDEVDAYIKLHNVQNNQFEFDPRAVPGLVLIEDPYTKKGTKSYGSYFVFRKLEQNVKNFKEQEGKIGGDIYGKDTEESERAGARLVGRFEDGTPITLQGEDKLIGSGAFNNFNYSADPSGGKCPHFAHIRKTNPRKANKFDNHTMARRGIPYGHRNVDTSQENIHSEQFPAGEVGLLFMSYQRSIVDQFELIQLAANERSHGGVDPVIGQNSPRDKYTFPKDKEVLNTAKLHYSFDQHIKCKGGEYFFAPSITYLKGLQ